jgi:hypothetical protein
MAIESKKYIENIRNQYVKHSVAAMLPLLLKENVSWTGGIS